MIQRIQSIFLFLVVLAMVSFLFFPIWQKIDMNANETATMTAFVLRYESFDPETGYSSMISEKEVFYISIPAVLSAFIAFISIFSYSNRLRQIQFGAFNALFIAATLGISLYFILKAEKGIAPENQGTYLAGFYLPVIALIFNLMSNRFIRRDEKLVRSADRIR